MACVSCPRPDGAYRRHERPYWRRFKKRAAKLEAKASLSTSKTCCAWSRIPAQPRSMPPIAGETLRRPTTNDHPVRNLCEVVGGHVRDDDRELQFALGNLRCCNRNASTSALVLIMSCLMTTIRVNAILQTSGT